MDESIFPEEIIAIILSYLPVLSLLRFKSVCRSWLALINSPRFIQDHMSQSLSCNSNRMLVVAASDKEFYTWDFDTPNSRGVSLPLPRNFEGRRLEIGGSCNGVVCLYDVRSDADIILLNPSTRMCKVIPAIGCTSYIGLGFDSINDDYKIVRKYHQSQFIRPNHLRITPNAVVYSLRNDTWTPCNNNSTVSKIWDCEPCGVLVKSHLLHWVLLSSRLVISFDACNNNWSEMLLPDYGNHNFDEPHYSDPYYSLRLGSLDGCLCFYMKRYNNVDIWVMKEYGNADSWVKLAYLENPLATRFLTDAPFAFSKQGGQILLVNAYPGGISPRFLWYDLHEKTVVNTIETHGIPDYDGALLCNNTLTRLAGGVQIDH